MPSYLNQQLDCPQVPCGRRQVQGRVELGQRDDARLCARADQRRHDARRLGTRVPAGRMQGRLPALLVVVPVGVGALGQEGLDLGSMGVH